ncbi:MAG TPA: DpnI domain-containing protein [Vitreimonas sp.]|nr:DpnI domain-containing protein [Vitreimonas sp.]
MPTSKQLLGTLGEKLIAKTLPCPSCKKHKTLKELRQNFKCADIICDYCGYLAQVKTVSTTDITTVPKKIIGAAWEPLKERMDDGRYFSLFIVLIDKNTIAIKQPKYSVLYLPAELQTPEMFIPRKPLSQKARRAGWQGVTYDLERVKERIILLK